MQETRIRSPGQEDSLERKWQSMPVFFPGKSHGQKSLAGYNPRSHKRVGHDLATKTTTCYRRGSWEPSRSFPEGAAPGTGKGGAGGCFPGKEKPQAFKRGIRAKTRIQDRQAWARSGLLSLLPNLLSESSLELRLGSESKVKSRGAAPAERASFSALR